MTRDQSRRSFLVNLVGSTSFLSTAATSLNLLSPRLAAADGVDAYWELVRQQFPFQEDKVPMNAANLCPSLRAVAEKVVELTRDIDVDCSFNNRGKFEKLLEASRQKVAEQLGVTSDEIALVRNTSEANNAINNGLSLKPGDEIVLWDQNHPTNNVAWEVRAARFQLALRRVTTAPSPGDAGEIIRAFELALTPKTRVLALTHVSNVSGLRLPVRELCDLAHQRGIHVHVDGAQAWGALSLNLHELGCDSFAASAHKWFVGPKEVGLLYVRQDRIPQIWPSIVAPGWGDDAEPDVKGARKFESLGQRDDASLAAIGTTADFHHLLGPARIETRVHELTGALKQGFKEAGIKMVTPEDPRLSAGVCVIHVAAQNRQQVFNRLYEEYGIAGATTGGLRLCPHIYNTMDHIQRVLQAVRAMRKLIAA